MREIRRAGNFIRVGARWGCPIGPTSTPKCSPFQLIEPGNGEEEKEAASEKKVDGEREVKDG